MSLERANGPPPQLLRYLPVLGGGGEEKEADYAWKRDPFPFCHEAAGGVIREGALPPAREKGVPVQSSLSSGEFKMKRDRASAAKQHSACTGTVAAGISPPPPAPFATPESGERSLGSDGKG